MNHFIEHELVQKLLQADFVAGLLEVNTDRREHPESRVCDFLEQQGSYIKYGMIERRQYMDLVGAYASSIWQALKPVVALRRAAPNSSAMYENFEYVASLDLRRRRADTRREAPLATLLPEDEWRAVAADYVAAAGVDAREAKPLLHPR
ncbi:MAG: hypothetical protein JO165_13010 [Candidatus Eremiobacteraeota bacterium]|nr:hypothetical protein [Candidatus Eremiobacteraeota bacterium]